MNNTKKQPPVITERGLLLRIDGKLDGLALDMRRAKKRAAIAGAVAGGISGAIVSAGIALIQAKMGG